jgi:AAA domain, putative AbiEii toxin, Type IV TA system
LTIPPLFGTASAMRLSSFEVQGFKNLVEPVRLEGLEPINVLHGANNVGKSNLLQAMGLFFFLVGHQGEFGQWSGGAGLQVPDAELARLGFPHAEVFNRESPAPIVLQADVSITPEDLERAGKKPTTLNLDRLRVAVELRWMGTLCRYSVQRFETADGRDFRKEGVTEEVQDDVFLALDLLSKNVHLAAEPVDSFALIPVQRLEVWDLALVLYDARDSPDVAVSRTWDRFVEIMSAFGDILGEGKFVPIYDRKAQRANLVYETARARIPLQLLGSGVQQIVALFGRVITCGASIVAVEEPELNLRWSLQERVRDALRDLVGKEGAPSQIFLTSHSGAFETSEAFYLVQRGPAGHPTVDRRPLRDLPLVLGGVVPEGSVAAPRAPTHVSSEGTLRLPERIRKVVGIEHGGNVSFVDKGDGVAEMMSVDTFLKRAGLDDDT